MQHRERLHAQIIGAVVIAFALMAALLVISGRSADAARPDPATYLQCSGDRFITTEVTHDSTTKETRTPGQLADAWVNGMAGQRPDFQPVAHRDAFSTENGRDVAFTNTAGRVVAVLSYERDANLGWRLESAIECA